MPQLQVYFLLAYLSIIKKPAEAGSTILGDKA